MRAPIAALAVAALATIGLVAVDAPAQAAGGCVTRAEYRQVHRGMTKAKVDRKLGTRGHRETGARSGGYRSEIWSYNTCDRWSVVSVAYDGRTNAPLKLSAKSAVWAY